MCSKGPGRGGVRLSVCSAASVPGGFSVVVGVTGGDATECPGDIQGQRRSIALLNRDGYRGAARGVQDVHAVWEKFFGQALAAVIRVGEKFIDDRYAVTFGDDGGRDLTVGSGCYEGRCLGGPCAASGSNEAKDSSSMTCS